jgi:hypothetical protein
VLLERVNCLARLNILNLGFHVGSSDVAAVLLMLMVEVVLKTRRQVVFLVLIGVH